MKRILIVYSTKKDVEQLAQGLKNGFTAADVEVDLEVAQRRERPISLSKYDLVMVGSPVLGFFGGGIDNQIAEFLKDCKATIGQKTIAFVDSSLLGTTKALRKLMKQLESKGCMVYDFRSFKNLAAAEEYAAKFNLEK
ncbi:MAG: flavodoxin family protein [Bacillota bacterium]